MCGSARNKNEPAPGSSEAARNSCDCWRARSLVACKSDRRWHCRQWPERPNQPTVADYLCGRMYCHCWKDYWSCRSPSGPGRDRSHCPGHSNYASCWLRAYCRCCPECCSACACCYWFRLMKADSAIARSDARSFLRCQDVQHSGHWCSLYGPEYAMRLQQARYAPSQNGFQSSLADG
jgi:hypothetical protein